MIFADVHCHILYGVDDGARSEENMYEMLDCAYEAGVRYLCATPHCNPNMFTHKPDSEAEAFEKLKKYASEKYPDMQIFKGNEVFVHSELPSAVTERGVGIFPDDNTVLIEFYPDRTSRHILSTVKQLEQRGYVPLIAHVERYADLSRGDIAEMRDLGALISVNAESITGANGRTSQKTVMKLLSKGLVDVVASDSHSKGTFSQLSEAYDVLLKKFDEDWLLEIFLENPRSLLS